MGNLISITAAVALDYFVASFTSMFWEHIFQPYDAAKNKALSVGEGILQFAALASTIYWGLTVFSFDGADNSLGLVPVFIFAASFSPNMMAKLGSGHNTLRTLLGFQFPSLLFSSGEGSTSST
jgi:hypothetical protein